MRLLYFLHRNRSIARVMKGALATACLVAVPPQAFSATDGTDGVSSNGSSGIALTIPSLVRIVGLGDLDLGTWSGSGDVEGNQDVCVYTNVAAGSYQAEITGNGTAGAFTLTASGNTLSYAVYWNDQIGTAGGTQVTTGVTVENQSGADTSSSSCTTSNSNVRVVIDADDLGGVPAGAYSGVLSIAVEPD